MAPVQVRNNVKLRYGTRPIGVQACCDHDGVWVEFHDDQAVSSFAPDVAREVAGALVEMANRADQMNQER